MNSIEIIDANTDNIGSYGFCGYRSMKQEGYRRKIDWLRQRFAEGMKFRILRSAEQRSVGLIEYVPGEYAWRGIEAPGYMVVHCIVIMSRKHKGKGYGLLLLKECLQDARTGGMYGVAAVTSRGTWMAGKELFLRSGFEVVDEVPPNFELAVKKFRKGAPTPKFKEDREGRVRSYGKGLIIIRSDQCPYIAKSVRDIGETADKKYGAKVRVVELADCREAQDGPSAYGVYGIIYDGRLIADHPISRRRFINIMEKEAR